MAEAPEQQLGLSVTNLKKFGGSVWRIEFSGYEIDVSDGFFLIILLPRAAKLRCRLAKANFFWRGGGSYILLTQCYAARQRIHKNCDQPESYHPAAIVISSLQRQHERRA